MFEALFWVILRSVAIPYVAILLLRETFLGEEGALVAVGLSLLIVTLVSILWNILKILGNTIMLRGERVVILIVKILIQIFAVAAIWFHYFSTYTDFLN